MNETELLADADRRARDYVAGNAARPPFPHEAERAALAAFREPFPVHGLDAAGTLRLLDEVGSPATVASNGPRYFGFVIGASLPAAAAADRLVLAWDNVSATGLTSPATDAIEHVAGDWLLEVLDLPREAAVGFGTSATACGLGALATARQTLLRRTGWDLERDGVFGAPAIRVVVSEKVHVTIRKALRVLGFGAAQILEAPVDERGRIDPARLPALDERTILCLQAGEVNTGEFDPFVPLVAAAREAGAWVHVDGAFGIWARASSRRSLTEGLDGADSWTFDGHKWLNTPYDGAVLVCRDQAALETTLRSAAVYAPSTAGSQESRTLEFSRRARGIPIWAALRTLGRDGVAELVDRNCEQARALADRLRAAGLEVLNEVVLNQVLLRGRDDEETARIRDAVLASDAGWFGTTVWQGRPAMRVSFSSWRTGPADVERLAAAFEAAVGAGPVA